MDNQKRNREALVDHIAEQDRILRRRNEQIARQAENAREAQDIIEDYQAKLSDLRIECSALHKDLTERPLSPSEELIERAEKAEADLADYQAMHSEQIKTIARLQKNPRPLTADDITDEMVVRGAEAIRGIVADSLPVHGSHISRARTATKVLLAALTSPPSRTEGAEELEALIDRASLDGEDADNESLADYLAARLIDPTVKEQS